MSAEQTKGGRFAASEVDFAVGERRREFLPLKYNGNNINFAKNLRKNATSQENHLWYDFLRQYKVRFQRQKAIGNYIVDFYCYQAKLVVEIDGSQHFTNEERAYDQQRTAYLEQLGLHVLRISNRQINEEFQAVCEHIDTIVKNSLSHG